MKELIVWVVVILSIMGFLIRLESIKKRIRIYENCIKVFMGEITAIFVLTVLSMNANSHDDSKQFICFFILLFFFLAYTFSVEDRDSNGGINSILDIIKCYMVTLLSFQSNWGCIWGAVFTGFLAFAIYKLGISQEKKSKMFEIIFLCVEAIMFCVLGWGKDLYGWKLLLHIFFQETSIYLVNFLITSLAELIVDGT